jgi:hypothetical protein
MPDDMKKKKNKQKIKFLELTISPQLKKEFEQFLEYHPARRVGRNLREVFMTYIQYAMDAIPSDIDEIIWDMADLMELFEMAEDETKDWPER